MIEVKNLTKLYGPNLAVDDISFTAEPGKIYGLLGPNGAGKSTTMNIMTGYIGATSGTVEINGKDILKDAKEAKAMIGYLPEMPPVYTDMSVYEYLKFVAELKKVAKPAREEQVERVMEQTKTDVVKSRLISNLSKGYRQRVGLAAALIGDPEIIILDEPSVGLDPEQIIELRDLIKSLKDNHTVILSSHILSEVQEICDYVYIINNGRLVASDYIENLETSANKTQEIKLIVKGSKSDITDKLSTISDIDKVEVTAENADGTCDVKVIAKENTDIREAVSQTLFSAGLSIFSMVEEEHSLEDVFLEITSQLTDDENEDADEASEESTAAEEIEEESAAAEESAEDNNQEGGNE